jgi:ferredoxin
MRIKLDRTICDGFGRCALQAPEYFSLDEWGYASLAGSGEVEEADEHQVRRAIIECPVHAIVILNLAPANGAIDSARPGDHAP